jgi:hypothetical protein
VKTHIVARKSGVAFAKIAVVLGKVDDHLENSTDGLQNWTKF